MRKDGCNQMYINTHTYIYIHTTIKTIYTNIYIIVIHIHHDIVKKMNQPVTLNCSDGARLGAQAMKHMSLSLWQVVVFHDAEIKQHGEPSVFLVRKKWFIYVYIYIWLVVSIPLKNMIVSWDDEIPNLWKVIKAMFQTTNQIYNSRFFKNESLQAGVSMASSDGSPQERGNPYET